MLERESQSTQAAEEHEPSPAIEGSERRIIRIPAAPSVTRSIVNKVAIKDGDLFFLTNRDGNVPLTRNHGFGLYYHDCRYLNGYELKLAGATYTPLAATAEHDFMAIFQFSNSDIITQGNRMILAERISVEWERLIDSPNLALRDVLTFHNYEFNQEIEFPVSLTLRSDFEDIFVVRGMLPPQMGELQEPVWEDGVLSFVYHGADNRYRSLSAHFSPAPTTTNGTTATFQLKLQPQESKQFKITLVVAESTDPAQVQPKPLPQPNLKQYKAWLHRMSNEWMENQTQVQSDSLLLNKIMYRSLRDLHMMKNTIDHQAYFSCGLPWFNTVFGRDNLVIAIQSLAYDPKAAEQVLRILAHYQGKRVDPWRDEQPGKILHELRVGELTNLNVLPYSPYYGAIDSTPLFLALVGLHAAWTGDLTLFHELHDNIELALSWLATYGDLNGDGFIDYQTTSARGLANQGWKDSGDAIVNADGSLAQPPIALVEIQGYVYLAKVLLADLFERAGEPDRAGQLRTEAAALREKFNRDFWLEDKGFYALALQQDGKPAAVLSSNPGQALWTGIAEPVKARRTVEALMRGEMFNGWGVRTLSAKELRYNPVGYHLGTVWPHDNSIIVAGFRRYGFDDESCRIFSGITEAALDFDIYRLPELFAGYEREEYDTPVHYPVACSPQGWSAGSIPFMLHSLLGLIPEAFDHRLRIVRPTLPNFVNAIELHRLRVGTAQVDLRFKRTTKGVTVNPLNVRGQLEIVVESKSANRRQPSKD